MLPYKSYHLCHNKDTYQDWKIFVFGEYAIFHQSRKKFISPFGDLWKFYKERGIKHDYFYDWRKDSKLLSKEKVFRINDMGMVPIATKPISFIDVHKILRNRKFNNKFEELLNVQE